MFTITTATEKNSNRHKEERLSLPENVFKSHSLKVLTGLISVTHRIITKIQQTGASFSDLHTTTAYSWVYIYQLT